MAKRKLDGRIEAVNPMLSPVDLAGHARDKIIVIGGYGQVGRFIATQLAPRFPDRLVIAGRNLTKAEACAADIGHGSAGREVDVFSHHADRVLEDVALVVMCLDQHDTRFVERCLSSGIQYLDITACHEFQKRVSRLDDLARRNRVTAVFSIGVAPGLTNLLAAHAKAAMQHVDRIDIFIQLGLGDRHGTAAIGWMLDNLDAAFCVRDGGRPLPVKSFGEVRHFHMPGRQAEHNAYRFNFSDQHVLARTLVLPSVSTWLCFDNRFSTWLVALCVRAGLGRLMRSPRWRSCAISLLRNVHAGSNVCAVAIRAAGQMGEHDGTLEISVIGHNEALMTAVVASEAVRQVLSSKLNSGVFHSDQIIALDPVLSALEEELPDLAIVSRSSTHGELMTGLPSCADWQDTAPRAPVALEQSSGNFNCRGQADNDPKPVETPSVTAQLAGRA